MKKILIAAIVIGTIQCSCLSAKNVTTATMDSVQTQFDLDSIPTVQRGNLPNEPLYAALLQGMSKSKKLQENLFSDSIKLKIRTEMKKAFDTAERLAQTNQKKAYVCYQIGKSMTIDSKSMIKNPKDEREVENWVEAVSAAFVYYEKAIELDPQHYKVAAYYKLQTIYNEMADVYKHAVNDRQNENGRVTIQTMDINNRKTAVSTYILSIEYAQKTINAAEEAYNNGVYEQDGWDMNTYQEAAQEMADASKKNAQVSLNNIKAYNAAVAKTNGNETTSVPCPERWHQQMREKAFFAGHDVQCPNCGKMIGAK